MTGLENMQRILERDKGRARYDANALQAEILAAIKRYFCQVENYDCDITASRDGIVSISVTAQAGDVRQKIN